MTIIRHLKFDLSLLNAACQELHLLQVVIDLQSLSPDLVHIRLSGLFIVTDSCPQSIIEIVLQGIDPISLLLVKGQSICLDHFDQVHA